MKTLIALLTLTLLANSSALADVTKGTYTGTATTTVYYYNALTNSFYGADRRSKSTKVLVGTALYESQTSQREANPFTLKIAPSTLSATGDPGDVFVRSAIIARFEATRPPVLVTYWSLQNTASGFVGSLTNSGTSLGMNLNYTYAMASLIPGRPQLGTYVAPFNYYDARYGRSYQATMSGNCSGLMLSLRIQGFAVSGSSLIYVVTDFAGSR